jgi:hypothetical protein
MGRSNVFPGRKLNRLQGEEEGHRRSWSSRHHCIVLEDLWRTEDRQSSGVSILSILPTEKQSGD